MWCETPSVLCFKAGTLDIPARIEEEQERQARQEADAERHREDRAREEEKKRQERLREQALRQEALREQENEEEHPEDLK